jgi:hypothetical protein
MREIDGNAYSRDPYWPRFLTPRAYDPHEHEDWLRRAAYAYPYIIRFQVADQPLKLSSFYGETVLDLDTALLMFERMAAEALR